MGKAIPDAILDSFLANFSAGTRISLLTGEPANFAAIAGLSLANDPLVAGDFVVSNGAVSGRRVTIAQQSDLLINSTGTATHVAIDDGTNLLAVTTTAAEPLTANGANTISILPFDIEVRDPI